MQNFFCFDSFDLNKCEKIDKVRYRYHLNLIIQHKRSQAVLRSHFSSAPAPDIFFFGSGSTYTSSGPTGSGSKKQILIQNIWTIQILMNKSSNNLDFVPKPEKKIYSTVLNCRYSQQVGTVPVLYIIQKYVPYSEYTVQWKINTSKSSCFSLAKKGAWIDPKKSAPAPAEKPRLRLQPKNLGSDRLRLCYTVTSWPFHFIYWRRFGAAMAKIGLLISLLYQDKRKYMDFGS